MFAVIKTGGKQYRVAADEKITVMHLAGEAGDSITFDDVLMVGGDGSVDVGSPYVAGASVAASIVEQARGPKVIAFKKRRRKDSKRRRGHRQDLTVIQIKEILTGGAKPSAAKKAEPKKEAPKPAAAPAASADDGDASIAAGAAAAVAAAKEAGVDTTKFSKLDKPIGAADDLKLINGVGPAIEKKLNEIGVYHFWQVSAVSQEDIDAIEEEVGFKGRAERDEWKQQALDLMAGKPPRSKTASD